MRERKARRTRRLISWATVLAICSAIGFGLLHGIGSKLADEGWPYVKSLFVAEPADGSRP
jgi:hypothetical protein